MPPDLNLRALNTSPVDPITKPWPVKDIVYVAILGTVMLAAVLEWLLWLLAFLYCLIKAFQKADRELRWSTRILAVLNMLFFVAMRCIFLPIMFVTLPLPARITQYFPEEVVRVLQLFAFWAFAGLLTIPWLFCIYQLITHNVGRSKRIKTVLDEYSAPKVVIVMPCYNEEPAVLLRTVNSIVSCEYPPSCMHVFLSFDGDKDNELYLNTIEQLGVPLAFDTYPKSIDISYRQCRITVSRFPHGGKRACQKKTFKLIDKIYADFLRRHDNLFLFFIDSDCILDRVCIANFMYEMELKPASKGNMLAMTGVITTTTARNTLLTVLQDMEYIHGQLFERAVESACGAVTCLPGALTMLRFSAFRKMSKYYFADKAEQVADLFDYGKCHLGEDRWLTHLFMIGAKRRYQIQMNTGAFCKTEAVQTFASLLKQRRRWFLGFITNEVCMLTDLRLWKRYPLLLIIRLGQNTIRTTALLFFIMVLALLITSQRASSLPVGFIAVSLGLNWALMLFFGLKLGRLKVTLYPLMFVLNPFLNWIYMVYGIFTAGQRTWGGPRADAGKADENTTPAQVIERARQGGDELNVVPETFRPAVRGQGMGHLLPSESIYGRFAPAEVLPGGWYRQGGASASGSMYGERAPWADDDLPSARDGVRESFESAGSGASVQLPRRVETVFDDPRAALRAYECRTDHAPADDGERRHGGMARRGADGVSAGAPLDLALGREYAASIASEASDSSVTLHFDIPKRMPPAPGWTSGEGPHTSHTTRKPQQPNPTVVAPPPSHRPGARAFGGGRRGNRDQSPLARKSFTRLASPPPTETAMTMTAADVIELERLVAARSSGEAERRGGRGSRRLGRLGRGGS
ncbi:hypothetical protein LTR53_008000 [Teratosphaeriaceae sp. CCFEE 6253]|nr:hypothetical protein LTR53_008000 [Teratosphaeriaceae sp. CCFEE 6253]